MVISSNVRCVGSVAQVPVSKEADDRRLPRMSYIVNEYTKILPSGAMPTHPLLRPVRDFGL